MDYHQFDNFDNDANASEADYSAFVQWLSEHTAAELRQAQGNREQTKRVLCRYYKRGMRANLTTGELIDFLGVSTPSILDKAGFDDEQADKVMAISDSLTDEDINQVTLT
jgi:hypothetical protein